MSRLQVAGTWVSTGTVATATFVKIDVSNVYSALQCGIGDVPFGVCQIFSDTLPVNGGTGNAAVSGEDLIIWAPNSSVPLTAGTGGWIQGDYLKPDASGNGIKAYPGDVAGAIALDTATAGDVRNVLTLDPGSIVPSGAAVAFAVSTTLTGPGFYEASAADVVFTLPNVLASKSQTFKFTNTATTTALQAGVTGTQIVLSAADVTAAVAKVIVSGLVPVAAKGLTNTKTTATIGDSATIYSDGVNWYGATTGTWVTHA